MPDTEQGVVIIGCEALKEKIVSRLKALGVKSEHAGIVADSLVAADLKGIKSHGVNMLKAYIERIKRGGLNIHEDPVIIKQNQWMTLIDARSSFGQVAGKFAVNLLIEKASNNQFHWVGVKNSNHCGALSYYTERIAEAGFISFMCANANPTVAPYGGMEAVLGTNPISVGIPTKNKPIVLDMATSNVAKAKIYHAKAAGKKIDPEWALDKEGNPTDDAEKALAGALTAMGGPKGYGLSIVVDVLAGIINKSGYLHYVNSVHRQTDRCQNSGMAIFAFPVEVFIDRESYLEKIQEYIDAIKTSRPRPGCKIYIPGEIEEINRKNNQIEGIRIDDFLWKEVFGDRA